MKIRLKKLEISGFKTFRSPLILEIPEGMTAIVGPNGSGKSNLVDAILWAVGHQSARALRSERMEDVIFSGSADFPPSNLAEVSLHFEHMEGMETEPLVITRRLYRNGTSEYEINGRRVRLKDILDLCDRYHILSHSHTVIPQGHIILLSEMKPSELREFVEEISGIALYKRKKHESELKIEHTKNNLERIRDIIREVELQWEDLKGQADKVKAYRKIQTEIEALELKEKVHLARRIKKNLHDLATIVQEKRKELEPVERTWLELSLKRDEAWERAEQLEKEKANIRLKLDEARTVLQKLTESYETLSRQFVQYEKDLLRTEERIHVVNRQIDESMRQVDLLEKERADLQKALEKLEEEHLKTEASWSEFLESWEDVRRNVMELREKKIALSSKIEDTRAHIQYWQDMKENLVTQRQTMEQWQSERVKEMEGKNQQLEDFKRELHSLEREIVALDETIQQLEGEKRQLVQESEEKQRVIQQENTILHQLEAEYRRLYEDVQAMEDEEASFEAFAELIRKEGLVGHIVRFRDVVNVEKGEEEVIGNLLDRFFNDWIVKDRETAHRVVELLAQTDSPPAGIWVADAFGKAKRKDRDRGFVLRLRSTIPRAWVKRFLENFCYVIQDLQGGLAYELENHLWWPGRSGTNRGVWWVRAMIRRNEIEHEREACRERIRNVEFERQEIERRLTDLEDRIKEEKTRKQAFEPRIKEGVARIESVQREIRSIEDQLNRRQAEMNEIAKSIHRAELQIRHFQARREKEKTELEHILVELEKAERQLQDLERERSEREAHRLKLQRELGEYRQRNRNIEEHLRGVVEKQRQLTEEMKKLETLKVKQTKEVERIRRARREIEKERGFVERKIETLAKQVRAYEDESKGMMENLHQLEIELRTWQQKRDRILDYIRGNEVKEAEYRMQWEQVVQDIQKLAPDRPIENLFDEVKPMTRNDRVRYQALIREREAMGEINWIAEREFTRVDERLRFLRQQEADLLTAIDELESAIRRMDDQILARLDETLEQMNQAFGEYMEVFLGGEGELQWTEPEDRLQSGVRLHIRIPGKRVRSLLSLSGGEKTMVGLALLMAAHRVRPSVFMVLDEVDAPLDDQNVDRFYRHILEHNSSSQYLVITHNKRSIQYAKAIYGVTIDRGLSRVLSLRLDEAHDLIDRKSDEKSRVS